MSILLKILSILMVILGFIFLLIGDSLSIFFALIFILLGIFIFKNSNKKKSSNISTSYTPKSSDLNNSRPSPSSIINTKKNVSSVPDPTAHSSIIYNSDFVKSNINRFIAFDLETTGLSPFSDKIIEISAITFENGIETSKFTSLINPEIKIPKVASSINHITDDMVRNAPTENEVIPDFLEYIKDVLSGDIVLVSHNAPFDMKFLMYSMKRLNITGDIPYQDTLYLSRNYCKGLENYKLNTVAKHFNIYSDDDLHRAESDTRLCGKIFFEIMNIIFSNLEFKVKNLTEEELEICKYLKNLILSNSLDTDLLAFKSSTYFTFNYLYTILKFKVKGRKKYLIIPNDIEVPESIVTEPCTKSEGLEYKRCIFNSIDELSFLNQHIVDKYKATCDSAIDYANNSNNTMKKTADAVMDMIFI